MNNPIFVQAHDGAIFACKYNGTQLTITNKYGKATTGDRKYILKVLATPLFDKNGRLKSRG